MNFPTLKDRQLYFRGLTDYNLQPGSYLLIMLDGRSFSSVIKKNFSLPFDKKFHEFMDKTAVYVARNVQNCRLAYTQSDEISLIVTDWTKDQKGEVLDKSGFFGYRLSKILSIVASMASVKFYQLVRDWYDEKGEDTGDIPIYNFDCKAWTVPTRRDAFGWFLYRQRDAIRNSKQQFAQTWMKNKEISHKTADEQIQACLEETGNDWTKCSDGEKYGRIIVGSEVSLVHPDTGLPYTRVEWNPMGAKPLETDEMKNLFNSKVPHL